jgi:nucleoside-diphosphate-sugar epimerase
LNRSVLVTGASGFVGQHLVRALAADGWRVRAATRTPAAVSFPATVDVVRSADYAQAVDWATLIAGMDAVVHAGGLAHRPGADADYDRLVAGATGELVAACAASGARRLIFVSSLGAQTGSAAGKVITEQDAPAPTKAYGRAKLKAEDAVRAGELDWTILRPSLIYGPLAKGNFAKLLRLADTALPLPLASFAARRSLLGIDNLTVAVAFALGAPQTVRETYLVADPLPIAVADIIAALREGFGRPRRLFAVPPAWFALPLKGIGKGDVWEQLGRDLVVDPGKLIAAGWRPEADTYRALAAAAAAHKQKTGQPTVAGGAKVPK